MELGEIATLGRMLFEYLIRCELSPGYYVGALLIIPAYHAFIHILRYPGDKRKPLYHDSWLLVPTLFFTIWFLADSPLLALITTALCYYTADLIIGYNYTKEKLFYAWWRTGRSKNIPDEHDHFKSFAIGPVIISGIISLIFSLLVLLKYPETLVPVVEAFLILVIVELVSTRRVEYGSLNSLISSYAQTFVGTALAIHICNYYYPHDAESGIMLAFALNGLAPLTNDILDNLFYRGKNVSEIIGGAGFDDSLVFRPIVSILPTVFVLTGLDILPAVVPEEFALLVIPLLLTPLVLILIFYIVYYGLAFLTFLASAGVGLALLYIFCNYRGLDVNPFSISLETIGIRTGLVVLDTMSLGLFTVGVIGPSVVAIVANRLLIKGNRSWWIEEINPIHNIRRMRMERKAERE